ncbi:hypothetical protein [Baekduia soli]|uniref:hypothetical protein n=1 Tax=Baekduia soli TaxID=496014 RepID=UPI001651C021|nr:hypothetical protein [Baekduia soli]
MPSAIRRRGAVLTAAAAATLGLAVSGAPAAIVGLPPGAQVNDDVAAGIDPGRDAGVSDVVSGSLAAGGVRVPWATFEQKTAGAQQIFVRAFKGGVWSTQGGALNIDPTQEAEAPSIDFAGAGRTVPWTAWYEPNPHLGTATNIFASRFDATARTWIPEGQDRAPAFKVPSLNIHTDRDAENPAVAGGATVAGNNPVPWVAWQERDGGASNAASPQQIFVSRGIKATDCSANQPGGGTSVSQFCWQQTGIKRTTKAAATSAGATDPTLNIDPTRDGVEPDAAFTGPGDTVPWITWYEQGTSGIGLRGTEQVFAAKGVADPSADGGFRWVAVGRGTAGRTEVLDATGTHGFGACAVDTTSEDACSQNAQADHNAEDPRIASGTLTPGSPTVPWIVWSEDTGGGVHAIFVARLVGGDHFELFNGGRPVSDPALDASRPDITFSGNIPYISWHTQTGGALRTVVGHFEGGAAAPAFKVDGTLDPVDADVRSPISSSCTADPFSADGSVCPGQAVGTPFALHTTAGSPQRLLAHTYAPTDVSTGDATSVTSSTAHLSGSANPGGAATRVRFEFGATTAYGNQTADQVLGAGVVPAAFATDLGGLPAGSTIHYRAVALTDFGTFAGPDRVLVTGTGGGAGGTPPPAARRHLRIVSTVLKVRRHGIVRISLSCPASHVTTCKGTLKITRSGRLLGSAKYSVKAGHRGHATVHLLRRGRVLAATHGRAGIRVRVSAGGSVTTPRLRLA